MVEDLSDALPVGSPSSNRDLDPSAAIERRLSFGQGPEDIPVEMLGSRNRSSPSFLGIQLSPAPVAGERIALIRDQGLAGIAGDTKKIRTHTPAGPSWSAWKTVRVRAVGTLPWKDEAKISPAFFKRTLGTSYEPV